jgi:general L-amino acid transport system permease protein
MSQIDLAGERPRVSPWNNPKVRSLVFQALLLGVLIALVAGVIVNARANLAAQGTISGFEFLNRVSGFDIGQSFISYSATSTFGRAFFVGLLNTLLVSGLGIVLATILGFALGVARLSSNVIVSKFAVFYVEGLRNVPLLLLLLFWYNAVLKPLPNPKESIVLPGNIFLNNRGLMFPKPIFADGAAWIGVAFIVAILGSIAFRLWAAARQRATGQRAPTLVVSLALLLGLPLLAYFALGEPVTLSYPVLRGFNVTGGLPILPEFVALLFGLVVYTAAFIAEIVRSGILAVHKGQTEAAHALGLRAGPTLNLVVIPQAMRVIIPPLTSEYLNLTKNSSLAVFIGYPDLVQVFAGTVLNQTGQAMECMAITMLVYLLISLITSAFMNWYNSRKVLVER